jgi:carbon-monoxide dehydrogenase medium subunit
MKAPPFDYCKPSSLAEVFDLLDQYGDTGRLMAGGQTLLATLNMRLSEPTMLIDLQAVGGLRGISLQTGCVRIGAMTTHSEIEDSPLLATHLPLMSAAAPHVAHRAIRNRGTLGGSLAFADPAAEWPACVVALDAVLVLQSRRGQRRVAAGDFFQALYKTALKPDEIIAACEFPLMAPGFRFAFLELARRHGDYAIVGLAATARRVDGVLRDLRLVYLGTGDIPVRARATEAALEGTAAGSAQLAAAAGALAAELSPDADLYNDARTKLHLAGVLLRRGLAQLCRVSPAGRQDPSPGGVHA